MIGDTISVAKDLMNNTQKLPRVRPREFYFALFIDYLFSCRSKCRSMCPSKEIHTFGVVIFRVYFYNIR